MTAVWRRRLSLPLRAAALAAAAPVAAPLALLYDLMLSGLAAAWLIRDRNSPAAAAWEPMAIAALYLLMLDGRAIAERWHIPVFPLAALAVLSLVARRAWIEAVSQPRLQADVPIGVQSPPVAL